MIIRNGRPFPELDDEAGMRCAKEIVLWMIKTRTEEQPRSLTWEEGWKLGMEEVLYRLGMDLSYLPAIRKRSSIIEGGN